MIEYQQTKARAFGRRGLDAVMGDRFRTVVVIDAAAWGGRLWEPGVAWEQKCVSWDGSRVLVKGGGSLCRKRSNSSTPAGGAPRVLIAVA